MEIKITQFKHSDLVKIKGRVDSSTAPKLGEALNSIIEQGRFRIILDMSELDFVSSAGLRVLINAQKTCKRYNRGEVVMAGVTSNVYQSLDLAGFTALFKIFDDLLLAVGNF
jgi:anti-sigma B factor antagonist